MGVRRSKGAKKQGQPLARCSPLAAGVLNSTPCSAQQKPRGVGKKPCYSWWWAARCVLATQVHCFWFFLHLCVNQPPVFTCAMQGCCPLRCRRPTDGVLLAPSVIANLLSIGLLLSSQDTVPGQPLTVVGDTRSRTKGLPPWGSCVPKPSHESDGGLCSLTHLDGQPQMAPAMSDMGAKKAGRSPAWAFAAHLGSLITR